MQTFSVLSEKYHVLFKLVPMKKCFPHVLWMSNSTSNDLYQKLIWTTHWLPAGGSRKMEINLMSLRCPHTGGRTIAATLFLFPESYNGRITIYWTFTMSQIHWQRLLSVSSFESCNWAEQLVSYPYFSYEETLLKGLIIDQGHSWLEMEWRKSRGPHFIWPIEFSCISIKPLWTPTNLACDVVKHIWKSTSRKVTAFCNVGGLEAWICGEI